MKILKFFEEFHTPTVTDNGTYETIMIIGLPASGKTTLSNKIQRENPSMKYVIYDDFRFNKALENIGKENMIISDGMFITGVDRFVELVREHCEPIIYSFENDPKQCIENTKRRWETMTEEEKKINHVQAVNTSIGEIGCYSQSYKIPSGAIIVPVYRLNQ